MSEIDADKNLVPLAVQFPAIDHVEPPRLETIWENPTDREVALDLHVGTSPRLDPTSGPSDIRYMKPRNREELLGLRLYRIPAKSQRAIPIEFDQAIQSTVCEEPECGARKALCRNPKHRVTISGGLGPQLRKITTQERHLHPTLAGTAQPALLPPVTAAAMQPTGAEDRAMERAAARRGGAK